MMSIKSISLITIALILTSSLPSGISISPRLEATLTFGGYNNVYVTSNETKNVTVLANGYVMVQKMNFRQYMSTIIVIIDIWNDNGWELSLNHTEFTFGPQESGTRFFDVNITIPAGQNNTTANLYCLGNFTNEQGDLMAAEFTTDFITVIQGFSPVNNTEARIETIQYIPSWIIGAIIILCGSVGTLIIIIYRRRGGP